MAVSPDIRSGRQPRSRSASVRSILALAGGAAAIPLAEAPADAAIIVDSTLSGTVIGWNTGGGQTASVSRSLPGTGGGFSIGTRAVAGGGLSAGGYVGVAVAGAGATVYFQRSGSGLNQAFLASFGATVNSGSYAAKFANVNLGTASGANDGNAAFSGTSAYLLFSFSNSGTTNYGWIELTAATTGFTGGGASQYSATLGKWAYDDSGAPLEAGYLPASVPEIDPNSAGHGVALIAGFLAWLERQRGRRGASAAARQSPTAPQRRAPRILTTAAQDAAPEPATASMAMAGALVAGAVGLRRWRKQRAQVAPAGAQA